MLMCDGEYKDDVFFFIDIVIDGIGKIEKNLASKDPIYRGIKQRILSQVGKGFFDGISKTYAQPWLLTFIILDTLLQIGSGLFGEKEGHLPKIFSNGTVFTSPFR